MTTTTTTTSAAMRVGIRAGVRVAVASQTPGTYFLFTFLYYTNCFFKFYFTFYSNDDAGWDQRERAGIRETKAGARDTS